MAESLFEICFNHVDSCPGCDYGARKLCPTGRQLFNAAHEACRRLAGGEVQESDKETVN